MKKFSFLFLFLAVFITACSACAKKTQVETNDQQNVCTEAGCPMQHPSPSASASASSSVTPPPANVPDVVSQDNWKFTLIGPGWIPSTTLPAPEIKVMFKSIEQNIMLFLVKEQTTHTYPEYVLGSIRAMRSGGVTIESAKQTTIGTDSFVLVTASGEGNTLFTWLTVKNGFGYAFSCGGPTNLDAGATPCTAMANTLTIQ